MKRREFFNKAAISGLGLGAAALLLPKEAIADLNENSEVGVLHEISRNHGHELVMNLNDLLVVFRRLKLEEKITIDIKGKSRHAHSIELTFDQALNILLGETLVILSSKDAGHSHSVSVTLKIEE